MSHANCLTHCFCAEFLHGSCNITFIRLPTLEKQKFENGVCCTTYKAVQSVKAMPDTKFKHAMCFEKINAFPLKVRNYLEDIATYLFLILEKGVTKSKFVQNPLC